MPQTGLHRLDVEAVGDEQAGEVVPQVGFTPTSA